MLVLLASTKKSGELHVAGTRTPPGVGIEGRLWFDGGRLTGTDVPRAVDAPDAVFELLRLTDGTFSFGDGSAPAPEAPLDVEPVLTDAQARLVEWKEIEAVVPSPTAWLQLAAETPGTEVTLRGDQWSLVVAIGSGCTVDAVVTRLGGGELAGCRAVKELVEAGLVSIAAEAVVADQSAETRR
ncbi:MAG TPA: DUF4388 domain-containing protein, partial [Acidimicrobiales bacterium]